MGSGGGIVNSSSQSVSHITSASRLASKLAGPTLRCLFLWLHANATTKTINYVSAPYASVMFKESYS